MRKKTLVIITSVCIMAFLVISIFVLLAKPLISNYFQSKLEEKLVHIDGKYYIYEDKNNESYTVYELNPSNRVFNKIVQISIPGSFKNIEFVTVSSIAFGIFDKYIYNYGVIRSNKGWGNYFEFRRLKTGRKIWGSEIEECKVYGGQIATETFKIDKNLIYLITTHNQEKGDSYSRIIGKNLECKSLTTGEKVWSQSLNEINKETKYSWTSQLDISENKITLIRESMNYRDVLFFSKENGHLIK